MGQVADLVAMAERRVPVWGGVLARAMALLLLDRPQLAPGHSWPENPLPRGYRQFKVGGGCVVDETGADSWHGNSICGKDALGLDIRNLRPSSFMEKPCTITRDNAGYDDEFQMTRVVQGGDMCVSWAANAHNNDATRDLGGGVRIAISSKAEPTMAEFEANVISYIPYDRFEGALIRLPEDLAPGKYTMQFAWDWPTGVGRKFLHADALAHLYANCMDIVVTEKGDSSAWTLGTKLSGRYMPEGCLGPEARVYDIKEKPASGDPSSDVGEQMTEFVPGVDPVMESSSGLLNPDFSSAMMGWNLDQGNAEVVAGGTEGSGLMRPTLRLEPAEFGSKVTQVFDFQANVEYVLQARVSLRGGIALQLDIQNLAESGPLKPGGTNPNWPHAKDNEGWHKVAITFKPTEDVSAPIIVEVDRYQRSGVAFVDSVNILGKAARRDGGGGASPSRPTPAPPPASDPPKSWRPGAGTVLGALVGWGCSVFLAYHYGRRAARGDAAVNS